MNLREIEERVAAVQPRPGVEFLGDLLLAYGLPEPRFLASRQVPTTEPTPRTRGSGRTRSTSESPDEVLYEYIDAARADERVIKHRPRFLIVKNHQRLLAGDLKTGATLDIKVDELASKHAVLRCLGRLREDPAREPQLRRSQGRREDGQALRRGH